MGWRDLIVAATTAVITLVVVGVLIYSLRDYVPVIASTYEFRSQGEGGVYKMNR